MSSSEHGWAGVSVAVCSPSSICAGTAESCGRSGCSSRRPMHTDFHSVSASHQHRTFAFCLPPSVKGWLTLCQNFLLVLGFEFCGLKYYLYAINYPAYFWARPLSCCWSCLLRGHLYLTYSRPREGGREEGKAGPGMGFETSQPTSSIVPSPTRTHLLQGEHVF